MIYWLEMLASDYPDHECTIDLTTREYRTMDKLEYIQAVESLIGHNIDYGSFEEKAVYESYDNGDDIQHAAALIRN
jgi:hypothetical protein